MVWVLVPVSEYSTVRLVRVWVLMVYWELKSAVAVVLETLTVPDPVKVPVAPEMMSAAAGEKVPSTCMVPAVAKLPEPETVPLIVTLLKVRVPELEIEPEAPLIVIVPLVGAKVVLLLTVKVAATVKLAVG